MHIFHEIVHPFLDKIGIKPIYNRCVKSSEILPYESLEWQVKALTGEIMMPYEATKGMSVEQIMRVYGVSEAAAFYRKRY